MSPGLIQDDVIDYGGVFRSGLGTQLSLGFDPYGCLEDPMLAIVAAVFFLIALIFELAGITLSVVTATVLLTAGLLFLALFLAGVGGGARIGRL
jgi:hypothetical protein